MQLQNAIDNATGLHYVNAPAHGAALLREIQGHINALVSSQEDDPLLFAYQCLEVLPYLARHTLSLEKWAIAVRDATPDQITDKGAQLCRSTTSDQ